MSNGMRAALTLVEYGETGLDLPEDLAYDDWVSVGAALRHMERNVKWWLGDWWRYGERRYGELAGAAAATGLDGETVRGAAWVATKFSEPVRRRTDLSFEHHKEVAGLPAEKADRLLEEAAERGMTREHLRQKVRQVKLDERLGIIRDAAPDLASLGRYPVVLADPPWEYEHGDPTRAIENNYPTMPLDEICELKVPAADDAMLFLWAPSPKLAEALHVIRWWNFDYRTSLVWVKPSVGPGYYVRTRHELLLVAMRGEFPAPPPAARPDSVFEAPRGEHSVKPGCVYDLIDAAYPDLPKVEMFARGPAREGWTAWGDQA